MTRSSNLPAIVRCVVLLALSPSPALADGSSLGDGQADQAADPPDVFGGGSRPGGNGRHASGRRLGVGQTDRILGAVGLQLVAGGREVAFGHDLCSADRRGSDSGTPGVRRTRRDRLPNVSTCLPGMLLIAGGTLMPSMSVLGCSVPNIGPACRGGGGIPGLCGTFTRSATGFRQARLTSPWGATISVSPGKRADAAMQLGVSCFAAPAPVSLRDGTALRIPGRYSRARCVSVNPPRRTGPEPSGRFVLAGGDSSAYSCGYSVIGRFAIIVPNDHWGGGGMPESHGRTGIRSHAGETAVEPAAGDSGPADAEPR
jgi:hypothetical protein